MSSFHPISATSPSRSPDGATTTQGNRQEGPVFSRTDVNAARLPSRGAFRAVAEPAPSCLDGSDESATFQERVQMLFDAKVPSGGIFSRTFEFNVSGVIGKITETGPGQLFIDFPERRIGMLLTEGVCTPTGTTNSRDVEAMQEATLLGLSS